MRKTIILCGFMWLFAAVTLSQTGSSFRQKAFSCDDPTGILCTEAFDYIGYNGAYTGHDEPSVLFYSSVPVGKPDGLSHAIAEGPAQGTETGRDRRYLQLSASSHVLGRNGGV